MCVSTFWMYPRSQNSTNCYGFSSFQGSKLLHSSRDATTFSFITFGVLSVIAGLLALILPETGDEDLPDTVYEAENLGDNPEKNFSQKQASEYNDDTLVRSDDCAQQSQYSTEVRIFPLLLFYI